MTSWCRCTFHHLKSGSLKKLQRLCSDQPADGNTRPSNAGFGLNIKRVPRPSVPRVCWICVEHLWDFYCTETRSFPHLRTLRTVKVDTTARTGFHRFWRNSWKTKVVGASAVSLWMPSVNTRRLQDRDDFYMHRSLLWTRAQLQLRGIQNSIPQIWLRMFFLM